MQAARFISIFCSFILLGTQAYAGDIFVERKLVMFPVCRESSEMPAAPENLAIIALNDLGEVNAKPCDRKCMTEKRYGVADAKKFPILSEFLAELKKTKPSGGKMNPDGLISFPDLGVCLFLDSVTSKVEFGKKIYPFDAQILHRLRESLKPAPPKN